MCQEKKQALARMNNIFCGIHTFVHMAEPSRKFLLETETLYFNESNIPIQLAMETF